MLRHEAVAACVDKMRSHSLFAASTDDQKAMAAEYAFERLHEDAVKNLPFGASSEDLRHYAKSALRRVHEKTSELPAAEFEQAHGFPILLVLGLLPTLWSWFKMLKEWMGW